MKNIYFKWLLVLSTLTISEDLIAQSLNVQPFETAKAPQTRDLGSVAFAPVNMYLGHPSISIPIYTINHFGLQIPISLTYDASGFVPDKAPGVVGLNWSLSVGGMITRNINNVPDESDDGNSNTTPGKSHGFFYGPLNNTNASVSNMSNIMQGNYYKNFYELSPDLFLFNFCGHIGKFIMGQDGIIKIESDEKFDIKVNELQKFPVGGFVPSSYSGKITITDADGIKYDFGESNSAIEYSAPETFFSNSAPNAWYLVRITTPEGNTVHFKYASEVELLGPNSNLTRILNKNGTFNEVKNVYLRYIECQNNAKVVTQRIDLVNELKSSSFSLYNNEQLKTLLVKDQDLNVKKKFNFVYDSYPVNVAAGPRSRNLLKSVGEDGFSPYSFEYYNTEQLYTAELGGNKIDYWGYYNNKAKPSQAVSTLQDSRMNMLSFLPEWEGDIQFARTGILSAINNPLKGKTVYEYEAHTYDHDYQLSPSIGWYLASTSGLGKDGGTPVAGGLRLSKIKLLDGATVLTRQYKYINDYSPNGTVQGSSGIITRRPILFKYNMITLPEAASLSEPPIYYSEVVESDLVGDNAPNGYTIHKFSSGNYPDISVKSLDGANPYFLGFSGNGSLNFTENDIINFYSQRSSASLERGKPESIIAYNSLGVPISGTQYIYNTDPGRYDQKVTSVIFPLIGTNPEQFLGKGLQLGLISTHDTYFFSTKLKKEVYSEYSGNLSNVSLRKTVNYNYNESKQLIEKITANSDGNQLIEKYRHIADYSFAGASSNNILKQMYDNHILSPVLEEQELRRKGGNAVLTGGKVTSYQRIGINNKIYRPLEIRFLNINSPSTDTTLSVINSDNFNYHGAYLTRPAAIQYPGYDEQGNLEQAKIPSGVSQTRLWGYSRQYPIADVKNAVSGISTSTPAAKNGTVVAVTGSNTGNATFNCVGGSSISLSINENPGYTYSLTYILTGPGINTSGILCASRSTTSCGAYGGSISFNAVAAGTYSLSIFTNNGNEPALYKSITYSYTGSTSSSSGNEIYQENFEEGIGFDNLMTRVAASSTEHVHTGKYAGKIIAAGSGEVVSRSNYINIPTGQSRKYKFSGWVYSTGPTTQLFLFMKRPGDTGDYSSFDHQENSITGKWVHMEKEFDVPGDVSSLAIRADNNGEVGGTVWFDDLQIIPADAEIKTYTYDPLVGLTSEIDAKGKTTYYEYDALQRLYRVKDQDGNILKHYEYNYRP